MAGSYQHCVNTLGQLRDPDALARSLENGGDVWEAVEELYGMIWFLADGCSWRVEDAARAYRLGIDMSPCYAPEVEGIDV